MMDRADMMTVRVLFFSVLRDLTGVAELELDLPRAAAMGDLLGRLFERWPRLREWEGSLLLAINHDYVTVDAVLSEGCEVAIMPPVQGG
jgi:molybdopterin converting factor subunit 1